MNQSKIFLSAGFAFVTGLTLIGCGNKEDAGMVAPPPPPPASEAVAITPATDPAAPPVAPGQTPPPGAASAAAIPGTQETGPQDIFKGMSQRDIDDFKSQATPETHDLNLATVMEAVTGFQAEFRRYPANIEELVKSRYLAKVLYAPKGKKYMIDQKTGEITAQ
ncbi:MAG TPA: hypothetical protein VGH19_15645 [Verrucomicrobiae bacterium]